MLPYLAKKIANLSQNYLTAILFLNNSLDKGPRLFMIFIYIHALKHLTPFNLS